MKKIRVTSAVAKKLTNSIEYLQATCQMGMELEMEVCASLQKIRRYPKMCPVVGSGKRVERLFSGLDIPCFMKSESKKFL